VAIFQVKVAKPVVALISFLCMFQKSAFENNWCSFYRQDAIPATSTFKALTAIRENHSWFPG